MNVAVGSREPMRNSNNRYCLCAEVLAIGQFSTFRTLAFFVTQELCMCSEFNIGFRKGRLVVIGEPVTKEIERTRKKDGVRYKRKAVFIPCKCECGNEKLVPISQLRDERVRSCGCFKKEMYASKRRNNTHYHSWTTPLFSVWKGMIRRCHDPKAPNRKYYFDRGISVCDLWREDFSSFEKWSLENGYANGLQIDRIDVNGDYEPENCRWVTPKENSHNRRNHAEIVYNGKVRRLVDLIDETGSKIDARTLYKRVILHGWDVGRALSEPKHNQDRRKRIVVEYNGKLLTTMDIVRMTGLNKGTVYSRLFKRKMTVEQLINEPRMTHRNGSSKKRIVCADNSEEKR